MRKKWSYRPFNGANAFLSSFKLYFSRIGGHFEGEKRVNIGFLSSKLNSQIYFDEQSSSLSYSKFI